MSVLPARELAIDEGWIDAQTGGNAFQDRRQAGSVRFAGGQKS
jgi:hypothetical protein